MAKGRAAATLVLAGTASLFWTTAAHAQEGVSPWELLTKRGSFIVGIGLPQVVLAILITITAAALIYNVIRSLERPTQEQEWVKQPELDEEEGEGAAAVETAAATAAAAAAAAQAPQTAPAPEPAPSVEPIFAPLKPVFTAPPPEVTVEAKVPEPQSAEGAPAAPSGPSVEVPVPAQAPPPGAPQEQYLAPAEEEPVGSAPETEAPTREPEPQPQESPAPEPEAPEPPPAETWVDQKGPEGP